MTRSPSVHIAGRLSYRDAIERLWRGDPTLHFEDVRRRTGAPSAVVKFVRLRLVQAGVLAPGPNRLPS